MTFSDCKKSLQKHYPRSLPNVMDTLDDSVKFVGGGGGGGWVVQPSRGFSSENIVK